MKSGAKLPNIKIKLPQWDLGHGLEKFTQFDCFFFLCIVHAKFNGVLYTAKYGNLFFYKSFLILSYYNTCVCHGNFERCDLNQLTWVIINLPSHLTSHKLIFIYFERTPSFSLKFSNIYTVIVGLGWQQLMSRVR